jgi:predicted nucleic acid-binding protein
MQKLLDTNILCAALRRLRADSKPEDAVAVADELIRRYGTKAICSPVRIEVLGGVRDPHELELTERFLERFDVVDQKRVPAMDWEEAERIAKRVVPYDREVPRRERRRQRVERPLTPARQFGDCMITAIAKRLGYDVITDDKGLIRQSGRTKSK